MYGTLHFVPLAMLLLVETKMMGSWYNIWSIWVSCMNCSDWWCRITQKSNGRYVNCNFILSHKSNYIAIIWSHCVIFVQACWTLSNVTCSEEHIEEVLAGELFPIIIQILKTEEYDISKEAAWFGCPFSSCIWFIWQYLTGNDVVLYDRTLANALSRSKSNAFQLLKILNMGVLAPVIQWLRDASKSVNDEIRELCEGVLSVEKPMKSLLSGYSRFQCGIDDDIAFDVLRVIMQFVTGSALNLRQELEMCGIGMSNMQTSKLSEWICSSLILSPCSSCIFYMHTDVLHAENTVY